MRADLVQAALLGALAQQSWQRVGIHPTRGEVSIAGTNEIAAKLRVELESKYAAHKQNGALILDDLVRARGLKDVEAEIASIHRKESFLFWKHVADNRGAPPAWTHTDMNIPALLGVK